MKPIDYHALWELGCATIHELETGQGILASAREEIYGCIFGRDSLITSLLLLRVYRQVNDKYFLHLVRKVLVNLAKLQGRTVNIESGEEPGKCIHEYRPNNHEHLTKRPFKPWYVYPDNGLKNYDSVDATPLLLITMYRYWQITGDRAFLEKMLPAVQQAINWLLTYGDKNHDGFIDFQFPPQRQSGGLVVQNWMDSAESVFHEDDTPVVFPVASVEVQAYTYLALRLWSSYFITVEPEQGDYLQQKADDLKKLFNERFIINPDKNAFLLASAIDGDGKPITAIRSSAGHCLWASQTRQEDGVINSILDGIYIPSIVNRLLQDDIFEVGAGIRTLSKRSVRFAANSYHNGSIWPHDTEIFAQGIDTFGYYQEAAQVRDAFLHAITFFQTPLELFVFDNDRYGDYQSFLGQRATKKQAWSAAAVIAATAPHNAVLPAAPERVTNTEAEAVS